ncbi:MAG: hypothetical protein GY796_23915 [Chloroflexi bacterium]|nr:hypothetical protein [Chloroflexota bacterium]
MMKNPHDIINNLSPEDAFAILQQLAADDEKLADEIASLALAYLSNVDAEEITVGLLAELESLTPEEVWDRAGNTRYGYVETGEAAEQLIQEALDPYLEEMRKYHITGLDWEARQMCIGLLMGFYLFEYKSKTEFKDWATDSPSFFASEVINVWREGTAGTKDRDEVRSFIAEEMPRWARTLF